MTDQPVQAETRIDWDSYPLKHYVRSQGWLPACRVRWNDVRRIVRKRVGPRTVPLKYFTFCASNAIDVFMLANAGIIEPSTSSKGFETVYFCEDRADEYEKIVSVIGQNGFQGDFRSIALFADDADTLQYSLDDDPPREIRKKLDTKELHQRLVQSFPFDIINLDMNGPFFPPKSGILSPMLQIVRSIMGWQQGTDKDDGHTCDHFTLLLTSHVSNEHSNQEAIAQLVDRVKRNIDDYAEFAEVYADRYAGLDPDALCQADFPEFFCMALPKIVIEEALDAGWIPEYRGVYLYEPEDQKQDVRYKMMSSVTHMSRRTAPPADQLLRLPRFDAVRELYEEAVTTVLQHGPVACEDELDDPEVKEQVEVNLAEVLQYREQYMLNGAG